MNSDRHKTMRKFRGHNGLYPIDRYTANTINANNINVTHVTNVTQVTNVTSVTGHVNGQSGRKNKRGHKGDRNDRPPRLFRYCASCGLEDQDVVSRMDSGSMCCEASKVIGYSAKGLASTADHMANNVVGGVATIAKGIFDFVGTLIGCGK